MSQTGVQANGARRGGPQSVMRSHEDIYDQAAEANRKAEDAVHRTDLMAQTMQRVETVLLELKDVIGKSGHDERGKPIGTGVVGDLMRLTDHVGNRFKVYDTWRALAMGFMAACCVFGPVLWWLLNAKLERLLK